MLLSSSAQAFLHLNEHHHQQQHSYHEYQHSAAAGFHHQADSENAHHAHLHVMGEVSEHDQLSFHQSENRFFSDASSRLISRHYTPPLPPPNA